MRHDIAAIRQDNSDTRESISSQLRQESASLMAKQEAMAGQIAHQSHLVADLCTWKPKLEARVAHLQATVVELQRAPPSVAAAATASGSGAIHGPDGHGVVFTSGGFPSVTSGSPWAPPVTGMTSLQNPPADNTDPQLISSQVISGLGTNAPNFPFPPFSGDNPNLWITLAEQYFQMLSIHDSFWVAMSILHFSRAAGIWLQLVRKKLLRSTGSLSLRCYALDLEGTVTNS